MDNRKPEIPDSALFSFHVSLTELTVGASIITRMAPYSQDSRSVTDLTYAST